VPDIRPTPDRIRETLFNWLGAEIIGARCLDLFAGSGALGLEALSRGAAEVIFVEKDSAAAHELRARLLEWSASGASNAVSGHVEHTEALRYLRASPAGPARRPFDIVFLDPPYSSDLLASSAGLLEQAGWLRAGTLIYVETAAGGPLPALPESWSVGKAKQAGAVGYHLLRRE